MLELKKFVKIIIFSIVLLFVSFSSYAQEGTSESTGLISLMGKKVNEQLCTRAGVKTVETFLEIQLEMIKSMDNMLPITIGGISIGNPGELEGLGSSGVSEAASQNTSSEFICECIFLPPFIPYRYGVTLSFWESIGVIDTTAIPYCSASLGMNVDIGGAVSSAAESVLPIIGDALTPLLESLGIFTGEIGSGKGSGSANQIGQRSSAAKKEQAISAHAHYNPINFLEFISEGLTVGCSDTSGIYSNKMPTMTEINPLWNKDQWSFIANPESLLVANEIAVPMCSVESLSILGQYALDELFWCAGTWGVMYPYSMNVGSGSPLSSYALLATRLLAERFQTGLLLKRSGSHMFHEVCMGVPWPYMPKRDINIHPVWPINYGTRFPIGYPAEVWGVGLDNPLNNGVYSWAVWQKRDCCFL